MKKDNTLNISDSVVLVDGEEILYKANVSRKIIPVYTVISIFIFLAGIAFISTGIMAIKNNIQNSIVLPIIGGILAVIPVFIMFSCRSTLNRIYVLTNKKIIVETGGKAIKARRVFSFKNIKGVSLYNNLIFSMVDICSIDFYAAGLQQDKSSIKLFSWWGSKFKFKFITREDGENIYKIIQEKGHLYD